jgi:glucan phosphoethanolaminetransferase (alkaline phosphatase superfamily)
MDTQNAFNNWTSIHGKSSSRNSNQKTFTLEHLKKHHKQAVAGGYSSASFLCVLLLFFGFINKISLLEIALAVLFIFIFIVRAIQETKFLKYLESLDTLESPIQWLSCWEEYYAKRLQLSKNLLHAAPILLLGIWSVFLNLSIDMVALNTYRWSLIIVLSILLLTAFYFSRRYFKRERDLHDQIMQHYSRIKDQLKD